MKTAFVWIMLSGGASREFLLIGQFLFVLHYENDGGRALWSQEYDTAETARSNALEFTASEESRGFRFVQFSAYESRLNWADLRDLRRQGSFEDVQDVVSEVLKNGRRVA